MDEDNERMNERVDNGVSDDENPERSALHGDDSADRAEQFTQCEQTRDTEATHVEEQDQGHTATLANGKPPTKLQLRKDKAKEKADELKATKDKVMAAINANSQSVNTSPKGTFDATYIATNRARIDGLLQVEALKTAGKKAIANDELKLSTMKLKFEIESAESDRVARAQIQTEMNISALLNVDPTGKSARLMMDLVDEVRRRATNPGSDSGRPNPHSVQHDIAAFAAAQFAAPAPPATIVIHSTSQQRE